MSDVIVVGAGPTGLLLAGDLAEAGISVTVLEKRSSGRSNLTRAFGIHARTMETFDARGLIDELLADMVCRVPHINLFGRVSVDFTRLPSRYNFMLITPQYNVERILLQRAHRAGVTIRYDTEVVGIRQNDTGVDVDTQHVAGNNTSAVKTYRTAYVVGCDGIRSTIRTLVGLPFPGREFLRSMMLADVRLNEPPPGPLSIHVKANTTRAFAAVVPYGHDDWWRIICWHSSHIAPAHATPPTLDTIAEILAEAHGTSYGIHSPRWLSRFAADERQTPHYRQGRVFLAGDAAHVHSPAGAQGMNTGLQDAAALAWRLTAALRGASPRILDGYHTERHPIGRRVIRSSGGIIRAAIGHPAVRSPLQVALPRLAHRITQQLAGTNIHYPRRLAHRLVGTHAPDTPLSDGTRLYEALRGRRPILLTSLPTRLDGWHNRITVAAPATPGVPAMLIRPDGYIAWATDTADPARLATALPPVLTRLIGPAGTTRLDA